MRELKAERVAEEIGQTLRQDLFEDEIPIDESDFLEALDRPTPIEPIPACRIHVEKPVSRHTYPALNCGAELERLLLIPDTHSPYEDRRAWEAMLKFARAWKPHTIIHVGDLNDFYAISDHDRDPTRSSNVADEAKRTNERLDEMDDLGAVRKLITFGNHDFWLRRHINRRAPELAGLISLDSLLGFSERGWIQVDYKKHARVGNLHVTHEVGYAGSTAVRNSGKITGHNIAIGHCHRLGLEYFGTVLGERYVSASLGWLGDFEAAEYKSDVEKAAWCHGFGTALMEKNGDFELQLRPIIAGRVVSI